MPECFPEVRASTRGAAILIGIYLLAGILLAGIVSLMAITTIRYRGAAQREEWLQARFWAESGISDAVHRLTRDPYWRADGSETAPALVRLGRTGKDYEATIRPIRHPDILRIASVGEASGQRITVRQDIRLRHPGLFSLMAREDILLHGAGSVAGPLRAGTDLTAIGAVSVAGAVHVGGTLAADRSRIAGPVYERTSIEEHPEVVVSRWSGMTWRDFRGATLGNASLSDTNLRISGSTELSGIALHRGTVLADGDLRIVGPVRIEAAPGFPALIVRGSVTIEPRGSLVIEGAAHVSRDVRSRGRLQLNGTLMARSIHLTSEMNVRPRLEAASLPIEGLPHGIERLQYTEER